MDDLDARLTAAEAAVRFRTTIPVICMWRNHGWLDEDRNRVTLPVSGKRGARNTYRLGDLLDAEAGTRQSRQRAGFPPRVIHATPYRRTE